MTDEQKKRYLSSRGTICPFCESHDISAGDSEIEGDTASQDVECDRCGKEWRDLFSLTEVVEL